MHSSMTETLMSQASSDVRRIWSVEAFERFWSVPGRDIEIVPAVLTEDVVGHWAGLDQPVRGREEYMRCIRALHVALPDVCLTVPEHAINGEFTFIRWIMHATGAKGPFEIGGIDRIRTRDGQLSENVVVFDTAAFEARSGLPVPWVLRH